MTKKDIQIIIKKHEDILAAYGVKSISLFGSYVRGEQRENSDIDLLVDFKDKSYETLKRALSRSLEIIGEASKNLSDKFKNNHPEVEWKKIAGLRDKLIHSYFGVDWYTVWDVVRIKIPELKNQLEKLKHG